MPIRRSPNDARYPRPQPGRDPPEQVVAINRNAWSQSSGARIDIRDRTFETREKRLQFVCTGLFERRFSGVTTCATRPSSQWK